MNKKFRFIEKTVKKYEYTLEDFKVLFYKDIMIYRLTGCRMLFLLLRNLGRIIKHKAVQGTDYT